MANDYEAFASKAYKAVSPPKSLRAGTEYAQPQYPSRMYPDQARQVGPVSKPGIHSMVRKEMMQQKKIEELKEMTDKEKKPFKIPFKWFSGAKKAATKPDTVVVLFLNIKGEIESPIVTPIHGNMVLIRNKVYEVDPRAFWTLKQGMKTHRFLIVKEIDRRPVSNLDLDEIKRRGDATDSDEFLIKMALRAQQTQSIKAMSKWVGILIGAVILGVVIFVIAQ